MDPIADPKKPYNNSGCNLAGGHSSDDDFDLHDVVIRNPRHSSILLADEGDGSEADLLGTTPPRSRIRNKERRRANIESEFFPQKARLAKRNSDSVIKPEPTSPGDRFRKRASLKLVRSKERDFKQDMSQREGRADSLVSPAGGAAPAVPTLVESCSRFMCLTSKLKRRPTTEQPAEEEPEVEERRWAPPEELPPNRVSFHNTFSMLINMGNIDKSCRRTISREEQVWQNELKDLIWLELQAKIAGRSLAQQDAYLCAQRDIVPTVVQNIIDYRFVNPNTCRARVKRLCAVEGSREDLTCDEARDDSGRESEQDDEEASECLSFNCRTCADVVGKAMREVTTLLDSYYNAVALYPSCKAMTVDHPLVATQLFKNRIKAMCLWYNTALHMRLKMLAVRRIVRTLRRKARRVSHTPSVDSDLSRQSSESSRVCLVRFNTSTNPSDSSNSESSVHSEPSKEQDVTKDSGQGHSEASDGKEEEDEVDCGARCQNYDRTGQHTPEIVIDSKYASTDTRTSSESGYASGDGGAGDDALELGALDDITRLRLLGACGLSPFRELHVELLKTQGVRRSMMFIHKLRNTLLHKVYQTLEKPDSENPEEFHENEAAEVFDDTKEDDDKTEGGREDDLTNAYERRRFGCWSEESMTMRLPSYRAHFLALSSICMETVHDYLTLRLETRPAQPSCLTVKQLINELKEGLDISTECRRDFVRNVEVALNDWPAPAAARQDLLLLLNTYDATVEKLLKQYLSYLTTMSETEIMGRNCLQSEWAFTARLARRVRCAALLAPIAFSDIACNQIKVLLSQFLSEFNNLFDSDEEGNYEKPDRYSAYEMCRSIQDIYARWREPLLHTAQWARALAAKLARAHSPAFTPQREAILNKLMSMRDFIATQTQMALKRTEVPDEELELTEGLVTRVRLLLLQMFKLGFEIHKELFKLVATPYNEDRAARRSRPASMQPLRSQERVVGRRRRPETIIVHETVNPAIHKEIHRVVNEVPRPNLGARRSVVASPPRPRHKFTRSESIGEDAVFDDKLFETLNNYGESTAESSIKRLLSGTTQSPESPQPVGRGPPTTATWAAPSDAWAAPVARAVVEFARCWMRFVLRRCDRGRGLRPRWASQGLEFLMLACDPCNTKHLTEEEFEELKQLMDGCISHVVGSRPAPRTSDAHVHPPHTPRPRPRLHSPSPGSPGGARDVPPPPTPPNEPEPLLSFNVDVYGHNKRVLKAIQQLEEQRDEKLRELKMLGRVAQNAVASYEPKLRQLTFKWQRGLKIGAGTFGKVYTVVNTESGQLLAMKELSIGAGDRRALQRAANELRVLEGVIHPHLVRYYGIELHREEMLLFMELCVEGSLEALVATSGALAEPTVRRYARQLVSAVAELHARAIVHRDIKSGNVFLTNEGHCLKLGDFGCAVKIRANTTAPGELQGFVGTQAYMAPEVFMKSEGHGRAADIWSLGCVVTEMASGKRPFSEYDSNYQIMFLVGMGGRPEIPESLSQEGREFCLGCLTHDPDLRPRADHLSLHHFLMVRDDDEDCKCEAAFLKT